MTIPWSHATERNGPHPLGRRVHPSQQNGSPSPTTPPKVKKTPEKSVSSQPRETRSSPLRTNKITAYFSSETTVVNGFHDPHQDEEDIEDDGDSSTSDIITFATCKIHLP